MKDEKEVREKIEELEQRIEDAHMLGDENLRGVSQHGIAEAVESLGTKRDTLRWVIGSEEQLP